MRYAMAIDLEFDGGAGRTRNMSRTGVYFTTTASLEPGAPLTFQIGAVHFRMAPVLVVRCRGTVVRVEQVEEEWGVGATIDEVAFERIVEV